MGPEQRLDRSARGAVAATLRNGQVLIAGGNNNEDDGLSSAELFNPTTDTFTKLTRPVAHRSALAARSRRRFPTGEVLIAGGLKAATAATCRARNCSTRRRTRSPGSRAPDSRSPKHGQGGRGDASLRAGPDRGRRQRQRPVERGTVQPGDGHVHEAHGRRPVAHRSTRDAVAATLPDGQVLIAGGDRRQPDLSSAELFNPATDTSQAHGHRPVAHRSTRRRGRGDAARRAGPDRRRLQRRYLCQRGTVQPGHGHVHEAHGRRPVAHRSTRERSRGDAPRRAGPDRRRRQRQRLSSAELFFPAAQAQIAGGSFGEETVGERSAVAVLTVRNVGAQALTISGATLAGTNAADFTVAADTCEGVTLAFRQECTISASFTPASEGPASATLTLKDNESEPAVVALSGTGVAAAQKPRGSQGGKGSGGSPRPKAEAANVELVTCRNKTLRGTKPKHCAAKLLKRALMISASVKSASAILRRAGKIYATGTFTRSHGSLRLVLYLNARKSLPADAYTLTLGRKAGTTTHASRQRVTLR